MINSWNNHINTTVSYLPIWWCSYVKFNAKKNQTVFDVTTEFIYFRNKWIQLNVDWWKTAINTIKRYTNTNKNIVIIIELYTLFRRRRWRKKKKVYEVISQCVISNTWSSLLRALFYYIWHLISYFNWILSSLFSWDQYQLVPFFSFFFLSMSHAICDNCYDNAMCTPPPKT